LISAALARDPAIRVVSRQALFDGHDEAGYDISHDGTRFLMIESESVGLDLVVIPSCLTELRKLTTDRKQ
jgi:hypothetical protein